MKHTKLILLALVIAVIAVFVFNSWLRNTPPRSRRALKEWAARQESNALESPARLRELVAMTDPRTKDVPKWQQKAARFVVLHIVRLPGEPADLEDYSSSRWGRVQAAVLDQEVRFELSKNGKVWHIVVPSKSEDAPDPPVPQ